MFFGLFKKNITPFHSGYLPEENGHQVFFHEFGNPKGQIVLGFHGGPGYYSNSRQASHFNLKKHRVILFDQRGGGQSRPSGEKQNNTTHDLLHDAKRLLDHLQIGKVILYGSSWGSTLALLFAQRHPEMVEKLILAKTFLARQRDINGIVERVEQFYPEFFQPIREAVPAGQTMRDYYSALATSNSPDDQRKAMTLYGRCEHLLETFDPPCDPDEPTDAALSSFNIYMHYDKHNYGVIENQILNNIDRIADIPTLLVHNRLDMICPIEQAWAVYTKMNNASLVIVPDFGHGSTQFRETLIKEIAGFLK